jgi:DNA-binding MarR family transcriptional regulator
VSKSTEKKQEARSETDVNEAFPETVGDSKLSYMIFKVARSHRGLAGELLRPIGLHPGQEILLMHLWDKNGQTQSELISKMGLDASTVTKMVQRLEAEGYIKRTQSETDRRAFLVSVTAAGQKLKSKVENMWAELNQATMKNLSTKDEQVLFELLQKAYRGLREY